MIYVDKYISQIGEIEIRCSEEKLLSLDFKNDVIVNNPGLTIFNQVKKWLDLYFKGQNPSLKIELELSGTPFQMKVWNLLMEIPYGTTTTYGAIAKKISPTMSSQAVGQAVGANPIAIIIPCHRVLGSNGKLGGYYYGPDKKKTLLKLENISLK